MGKTKNYFGALLMLALMAVTGFLLLREQPFAKLAATLGAYPTGLCGGGAGTYGALRRVRGHVLQADFG